jgi:hypothetical protein
MVQIISARSDKPNDELDSAPAIHIHTVMIAVEMTPRRSGALRKDALRADGRFLRDVFAFVQREMAVALAEFLELVTDGHVMMHTVAHVADFTDVVLTVAGHMAFGTYSRRPSHAPNRGFPTEGSEHDDHTRSQTIRCIGHCMKRIDEVKPCQISPFRLGKTSNIPDTVCRRDRTADRRIDAACTRRHARCVGMPHRGGQAVAANRGGPRLQEQGVHGVRTGAWRR